VLEQAISYTDMARRLSKKRIGDLLLEHKVVNESQLEKALEIQHKEGGLLGEILISQGLLKYETLLDLLSTQLNVPVIDMKGRIVKREVLDKVPERIARQRNIMPIGIVEDQLVIVMGRPEDLVTIDDINIITGMKICVAISNPLDIEVAIDKNYQSETDLDIQAISEESDIVSEEQEEDEYIDFTPAVQNLNKIINHAILDGASDIHLEPYVKKLRVRFRIDGILQDKYSLPVSVNDAFISRIKILSKMNIAETRRPQDGQFSVKVGSKEVDIRVATAGTSHGERATLRILDKSLTLITLDKLGFMSETLEQLASMLKTSFGMILVGGPTGSGKTTTLYSMINNLNRHEMNIMTIEDPIEYNFSDITQMQINEKSGISFASCLKAALRHDPDVILVGEIRDSDTAKIAVQAALTGHLVLASIHASDVVSMIFRLIHLGIEPYLISSTLIGLLAQRLVRCVCQYCAKPVEPTEEERKAFYNIMGEELTSLQSGEGCGLCANTGFHGRTGIFELLAVNDAIRSKLVAGADSTEIRHEAINNGMITIGQAGMMKVQQGASSMKDTIRSIHMI
jgi:type II secretory ATPase GspE/PulE/Tfp pilus assembly ATPase PilB-like protein